MFGGENRYFTSCNKVGECSECELCKLDKCFDYLRELELKAIPIFAYTFEADNDEDYDDGKEPNDFEWIERHVKQLEAVFEKNDDVITVVEAGFLGPWGEMHNTKFREDENKWNEQFVKVESLIDALLDAVPSHLQISVRLPGMIIQTEKDNERVGMFNNGMFANCVDYGTYNPHVSWIAKKTREEFIDEFMNPLTTYTIYGGEVLKSKFSKLDDIDGEGYLDDNMEFTNGREYNEYNSIKFVQEEAFKTHLTYLNYEWDSYIVHTKWR